MSGIIGRKLGMTTVFDSQGDQVVCTVIEAGPCTVTQVKTDETDGYAAIQLAFGDRKEKRTSNAMKGHFAAAGSDLKRHLVEFSTFGDADLSLGDDVTVDSVLQEGDMVHVIGTSKGKGFQGVVKRHGFGGVMQQSHGQHNRQRAPGSIGQASDPSRVFKGVRMAGRTGGDRVTVKNLRVVRVLPDKNLVLIRGAVPGPKKGILVIQKSSR
jgi:large subunit ribosomal protein L3